MVSRVRVPHLIGLTVFLIILRPNPGLMSDRYELILGTLLFLIPIGIFLSWQVWTRRLNLALYPRVLVPPYVKVFFGGLASWIVLSGLMAFITGRSQLSIINVFEFARYPVYALIFTAGYFAAFHVPSDRLFRWISYGVFVSCIVALIQLFSVPFFNDIASNLYGEFKLRSINQDLSNFRVYGTFRNANWFGISLVVMLPFILYHYRFTPLPRRLIWYGIPLVGIFISGSRSAWLGTIIVIGFHLVAMTVTRVQKRRHPFGRYLVPGAIFSVGIVAFLAVYPESYRRLQELLMVFDVSSPELFRSAEQRLANWITYASAGLNTPVLGHGPSQESVGVIENGYILVFYKYGLPGLAFFLFYLASTTIDALRSRRILGLVLASSLVAFAYGNINQRLIDTLQVVSLVLFVHGFVLAKIQIYRFKSKYSTELFRRIPN